jgi:hypothetical protein
VVLDQSDKVPKTEAALPEWQAAIEALMLVVEQNGPTMFARIGVMRALNRGHVRELDRLSSRIWWWCTIAIGIP